MGRKRIVRRRGRRIRIGEGLTTSRAFRRVYPEVGKVDTLHDVKELIDAIENDNISRDLKRKRLQFVYSLTFTDHWKDALGDDIYEARRLAQRAYQKYTKSERYVIVRAK